MNKNINSTVNNLCRILLNLSSKIPEDRMKSILHKTLLVLEEEIENLDNLIAMSKQEIIKTLKESGYENITEKRGGIEVSAKYRNQVYEFDYHEFINIFGGKIDKSKIHMIDQWTFTIECE